MRASSYSVRISLIAQAYFFSYLIPANRFIQRNTVVPRFLFDQVRYSIRL
jgi:hypothetical protein